MLNKKQMLQALRKCSAVRLGVCLTPNDVTYLIGVKSQIVPLVKMMDDDTEFNALLVTDRNGVIYLYIN